MFIDYYETLGISKDASEREIRAAYKRQAFRWHPDRNETDTTEKMQAINEAFLILSDKEARERYNLEYEYYINFCRNNNESRNEYECRDSTLDDWIKKARIQAIELAKRSLYDIVGMSKAGCLAAFSEVKGCLMIYVIIQVLALVIFLAFRI